MQDGRLGNRFAVFTDPLSKFGQGVNLLICRNLPLTGLCPQTDDGTHTAEETSDRQFGPGDLCAVRPGLGDVHRIYNATGTTMITLHCYGIDLVEDPDAINLNLNLPA